ncbi:hypothetical protein ASE00_12880 [Sphingomonas sp. Root710]|uniref:asparagine synthase-related protein n=1 Tax=Sphingomonas sp. Root710 TaxID=1736594 RepID=UPI0006FCFBD2|nr:asparagine synthase-related protein [Sphingomonas sp. Root710]KRB82891.1 hypothetical protein ASE00_12880 [Sphingomonas sp. Root710]
MSAGSPRSSSPEPDPDLDLLIVLRLRDDDGTRRREAHLRAMVDAHGGDRLTCLATGAHWTLWGDPRHMTVTSSPDRQAIVIGDLFDRDGLRIGGDRLGALLSGAGPAPASRATALTRLAWGRYVALFSDPATRRPGHVLRDPIGGIVLYAAEADGIVLLSPSWPAWLCGAASLRLSVDDASVAALLADPIVPLFRSAIAGTTLLKPGRLHALDNLAAPVASWSPLAFASQPWSGSAEAAGAGLVDIVDRVCRAWASDLPRVGLQLSGGLDSAIVLSSLAAAIPPADILAINLHVRHREGDERGYARAAAECHGVGLAERQLAADNVDMSQLVPAAALAAPRLYGLDVQQEAMLAAFARDKGITALWTGQGGDAVFFQMPYPEMAVDYRRALGARAYVSAFPWTIARRAQCSIWRIWGTMAADQLGYRHRPPAAAAYGAGFLTDHARGLIADRAGRHPWLDGAEALPPAKQRQLEAIVNALVYLSPTARGRRIALVHPLLSQPLIEYCLALPVFLLSADARDRSLARDAFSGRLPAAIVARAGKGESSRYSNRALVANLAFLRDHLLAGELVRRGLLDRARLAAMLDEDRLMTEPHARVLIFYAGVEAWLRRWS